MIVRPVIRQVSEFLWQAWDNVCVRISTLMQEYKNVPLVIILVKLVHLIRLVIAAIQGQVEILVQLAFVQPSTFMMMESLNPAMIAIIPV